MTRDEAIQALETGIMLACERKEQGYDILATGEMGIGNTTTEQLRSLPYSLKNDRRK